MNAVATTKAGVASGVLSMFRMIGGTFGVAALGALFQNQAQVKLGETLSGQSGLTASERADFAHQLTGGSPHLDGVSQAQAAKLTVAGHEAFIYGLSHAMVLSVGLAVVGVFVALVLIRGHGASVDAEPAAARQDPDGIPEAAASVA